MEPITTNSTTISNQTANESTKCIQTLIYHFFPVTNETYVDINSLNPNSITFNIRCKVIYKSPLRQYSTNGKVFDAIIWTAIFLDITVNACHIIIVAFNEESGRSDNIMTLKKNITIQSGDVRMANQNFNSSQSIYEIRLIPSSIINSYKSASFNPVIQIKQHQIINIYNLFHGSHVDVQGTIVYDNETTANISQSTGQSHTRRSIKIKGDTGSINVTIWNEKTEEIPEQITNKTIRIRNVKINHYHDYITLNSYDRTIRQIY
ncbi:unnamed protein product [Rotaria socialis]